MKLVDRVAVVTGAASGIGRSLAMELADAGAHLALCDIDDEGLRETAALVSPKGVHLSVHHVNVADRTEVYRFAASVVEQHGHVDVLINNAGVVVGAPIEDASYQDLEWIIGVNLWGVIHGTKAFLPHLRSRPEAHLANICGVHGLFKNRGMGPYVTTKIAVQGFTESLAEELVDTGVIVSCVHPSGTRTNILRNARTQADRAALEAESERTLSRMRPAHAAARIVDGIRQDESRILVGVDAHVLDIATRLFPRSWQRLAARAAG